LADTAVVEEAGEGWPALEHVVDGLDKIVAPRQFGSLLVQPRFEIDDQGHAELAPDDAALISALADDRALDLEQGSMQLRSSRSARTGPIAARG
jgi:hypothetical protein